MACISRLLASVLFVALLVPVGSGQVPTESQCLPGGSGSSGSVTGLCVLSPDGALATACMEAVQDVGTAVVHFHSAGGQPVNYTVADGVTVLHNGSAFLFNGLVAQSSGRVCLTLWRASDLPVPAVVEYVLAVP